MHTTVERGKWSLLGKKLEKLISENNLKSKSEKKPLKELFESFANDHDTTFSSTQQYYYTDIRPNLKPKKTFDESIEEFANTRNLDPAYRNVKNIHKIGDVLEVEVTSIKDFGVFCRTEFGFSGLIHISQIAEEYVTMPEDFFYVGEKVKVKILRYDGDNLSLSTRAVGGKEKMNPAFKDLAKKKIVQEIKVEEVKKVEPPKKVEVSQVEAKTVVIGSNDKDNIINFIKKYSDNNISQKALGDIDDLISQFGVFQTTMVLMSTVRDLDISSFITEMTKERLEGEYLRQL